MLSFVGAIHILTAMAGMSAGPASSASAPVWLSEEPTHHGVKLVVRGASQQPVEAAYSLEVQGDSRGGNRSTQRGTVRLLPDQTVTLITVGLPNASSGDWSATLRVQPRGQPAYEQKLGAR
jgi:hypothetical protein